MITESTISLDPEAQAQFFFFFPTSEIENNVTISLRASSDPEAIDVQGRGELQIGILVETMRREGFELTVSPPKGNQMNRGAIHLIARGV